MSKSVIDINTLAAPNLTDDDKAHSKRFGNTWNIIKTLVLPYWSSQEKIFARGMLILVLSLNLLFVYISVLMNRWNGHFFDALQNLERDKFDTLLIQSMFYVAGLILTFLAKEFLQNYLSFRWRSWMTNSFLTKWFNNKAFYKSLHPEPKIDNPGQRISQDINNFTFTTAQLNQEGDANKEEREPVLRDLHNFFKGLCLEPNQSRAIKHAPRYVFVL